MKWYQRKHLKDFFDGDLIRLIDYLRESSYSDYRYNNYVSDTIHYIVAAAFKKSHLDIK